MSTFAPSPLNAPATVAYDTAQRSARPDTASNTGEVVRGDDQVELSSAARILGSQNQPEGIRQDLVARIREEIASGSYESDLKLDATVGRLARDLG